jgi:cell division protein FtsQ
MKKTVFRLLALFVFIPAGLAGLFFQLHKTGFFDLKQMQIEVQDFDKHQAYFSPMVDQLKSSLISFNGRSLFKVDLKMLKKTVLTQPWVEHVQLSRRWPDQIEVLIKPKAIDFVMIKDESLAVPVLQSGETLAAVPLVRSPDAIVLKGADFAKRKDLRKQASDLMAEIPAEGTFSRKNISELNYVEREGFWMRMISSGIQVKMGQDQVPLRSARISQVLNYLEDREMNARVIDADLSKKVLVRLRKDP